MIGFLNSWTSGVVVSVIVGSIIEMILPDGNNKKYVKTVIGIFILFTIISPVVVYFSGGIDLKSIINFEGYMDSVDVDNVVNDKEILAVYEKNISKHIKDLVESNGYSVSKINVKAAEERYGDIESVSLVIEDKTNDIKEVSIDVFGEKEVMGNLSDISKDKIVDLICSTYGISQDRVDLN